MRVGIAGFGTIGKATAVALKEGIDGLELTAVSSGRKEKAEAALTAMGASIPVTNPDDLAAQCDVIVDCAPAEAFADIVIPALKKGRTVVTVSGAALLENPDIPKLAKEHSGQIILATGAILGLDAIRAAAEGSISSVKVVTRKPPRSLAKAAYLQKNNVDISNLDAPLQVFLGSAHEGALKFPANVNVAAAVGLAGIGAKKTSLEIWADPTKTHNTHTVTVEADSARFDMTIENVPTDENPGTGKITALSVIAALRSLVSSLKVGT